ncbi:serine/threonine-protein kinase [Streptomyces luteolus]|uniref:non-specific serine/threonine protein kinase n=1 Tax=Streptomyces luteolus TaxID=3043615 RepID=A0ABT6SYK5_9ACTN|nr:serine/threonine-protein kinase [Streptomyces sp. B-S-A12]MDI3419727.1 serine/threonine-protein kinase [Streptomyces sp. B-S-A12]
MSEAEQPQETQETKGRLLAGRYRLGEMLGRGGMGTVWRAVDETLGRTVAVKELRFPSAIDEDEKRRLITRTLREAKAIARIRNNGAVTVYDVVDEDDRPWIVMELIEGKSLAEVVRQDGHLTPHRAAEVGLAVLDVLRAAHREGILHRDVKPSNVLIAKDDGRVVLTDFGIAQVEGDPSITSTGMLVGAPSYISPERARGHKPGPAADLWSLGGLLYAAVEGVPPYDKGSAIATLTAVMTESLEPPRNAGRLEKVIYGLLEKDPDLRLDDTGARALLNDVINAPEDEPARQADDQLSATRVVPLPEAPAESGPRRGEAAAERLRGALRSVRNAAAASAAAGPKSGTGKAGTGEAGAGQAGAGESGAGANAADADDNAKSGAAKASSGVSGASGASGASGVSGASGASGASGGAKAPGAGGGAVASTRAALTDVVPKRTLVVVAVVVALAVLGTVFAVAFGGDEDPSGKGGKNEASTSAGATGDQGKGGQDKPAAPDPDPAANDDDKGEDDGRGEDTGQDEDDEGSGDDGATDGGVPAGYEKVSNGQFMFTMQMPEDFRRTGTAGQNSGAIFSKNGGFPRVQIDFNRSPGDDAAKAWRQLRQAVSGSMPNYRHIRIAEVEFNGYPTVADWEFERDQGGERVRVLNRGFKVDARRGYSIMVTCKADAWDEKECKTLRETAFKTFEPKD